MLLAVIIRDRNSDVQERVNQACSPARLMQTGPAPTLAIICTQAPQVKPKASPTEAR